MPSELQSIFVTLRAILEKHSEGLSVTDNTINRYALEGHAGPATLRAWGGKIKRPLVPVAWVEIGKTGVNYHLMGIYGNAKLCDGMSKQLKARLTGKSCFNFRTQEHVSLANELEQLTTDALVAFDTAGFISKAESAS